MRVFHVELRISGSIPTCGLLVSNHLSYIDILVLGSAASPIFVAKQDVRSWPVLGWFAQIAGTIFVHREKRTEVSRSAGAIQDVLENGALVVLFPEGTSSGGDTILPFKSSLLQPAVQGDYPVSAAFIRYSLQDGSVPDEVCYWREMTLLPHLINLLGKRRISASISFQPMENCGHDRKQLAEQLHAEITRLKAAAEVVHGREQPQFELP
jgi:1-acyl-sn-glycerol-3-phosphate acyltransferase